MDNPTVEQEVRLLKEKGKTKEEITVELLKKGATSDQLIGIFDKITEEKTRQVLTNPNYTVSTDLNAVMKTLEKKQPSKVASFFRSLSRMLLWSIFFILVLSAFSFGSTYIMAQNYKSLAQKARISGDQTKAAEYEAKSEEALKAQVLSEWFRYFGFMGNLIADIESLSNNSGSPSVTTSMSTVSKTSFFAVDQKGIFNTIRKRDLLFYTQALELYKKDTGNYPPGITQTEKIISATEANLCTSLYPKYLPYMFTDPVSFQTNPSLIIKDCRVYDTGYTVKLTDQNAVYLNAPYSENTVNTTTLNK